MRLIIQQRSTSPLKKGNFSLVECYPDLDPDLQIRGAGHPDPEMGEDLKNIFLGPSGLSLVEKI